MNKRKAKRIISAVVITALVIVISVIGLSISKTRLPDGIPDGALRAVFFDVGEADCSVFFCDGVAIMTDAPEDMTKQAIGYLKRLGIKRLDYFIITHYDYDHSGDALKIIDGFEVGTVLMPKPLRDKTERYDEIVKRIGEDRCVIAKTGQKFDINGVHIDILAPNGVGKENNDICIAYKLTYKGSSVLMCADIDADEEKVILSKYGDKIKSDIIKVPHHGSKYSSGDKFIKTVNAKYAVISCGQNNYGHPDLEVADRLKAAGAEVLFTQSSGVMIFDLTSGGVERIK